MQSLNTSISPRDQLVLLLIAKSATINHVWKLGMTFDRCDFPGNVGKNLLNLVNNNLIYVTEVNEFGHPMKYAVTEQGEIFLNNELNTEIIIDHIKKMSNPVFMLEIVPKIIARYKLG